MLGNNIAAHIQQRLGCFFFCGWIVPGLGPDHPYFSLGIYFLYAQGKGIDTTNNFRNRKGRHIPNDIGFGHGSGSHAGQIASLINTPEIIGHVFRVFIPGAVHEFNVRELLGHFEHGVHIAIAGRKNNIIALARHI